MELYDALEVDQGASADAIKRAYRRLALQHHPDKNDGDDAAFKRISRAHEVLADPGARALYDLGHREGVQRHHDDEVEITLTPDEVRRGGVKRVELELLRACEACGARGAAGELLTCLHCAGDGCRSCAGLGAIPRPGRECRRCSGERYAYQPRAFRVRFPAGVEDGHRHALPGKGGHDAGAGRNRDLVLVFRLMDKEVVRVVDVTLTELLCGFTRQMDGFELTSSGYFDPIATHVRVPDRGLVLSFRVVFPTEATQIARFTPAFRKMWKTAAATSGSSPPTPETTGVVSVQGTPPA